MSVQASAAAMVMIAMMAGCGSVKPPGVEVRRAAVAERTEEGAVIEFEVMVRSGADAALPLREVEYAVYLGGVRVFEGVRSPQATLDRFGESRLVLPAAVEGAAGAGEAEYRIEGTMAYLRPEAIYETLADAGAYRPSVGFSGTGRVDMGVVSGLRTGPSREKPPRPGAR